MILDRGFQHKILVIASEAYPSCAYPNNENELLDSSDPDSHKRLAANLKYLEEHQLIRPNSVQVSVDGRYSFGYIQATNKGMDFLADDGGLSAILGVVTVKFEADTLKSILENKINQSNLTPEQKNAMNLALNELPAEGIKHLTTRLLDEGIGYLPGAFTLISTYLGLS